MADGLSDAAISAWGKATVKSMTIADIGPRPQAFNLESETLENPNYRTVAWSGTTCRSPSCRFRSTVTSD